MSFTIHLMVQILSHSCQKHIESLALFAYGPFSHSTNLRLTSQDSWITYGNRKETRDGNIFFWIQILLASSMPSAFLPNECLDHISTNIQAQSAFAPCSSSISTHSNCLYFKAASSGFFFDPPSFGLTSAPAAIKISATFSHPPRTA